MRGKGTLEAKQKVGMEDAKQKVPIPISKITLHRMGTTA
jgi:hypothetical protein